MPDKITLKHIAREFDLDPYALRQRLRQKLEHDKHQRWTFEPNTKRLADAKAIAKEMKRD